MRILYDKKSTKKIVAQGFWPNIVRAVFRWPPIEIAAADEEDYDDLDAFIRTTNGLPAGNAHQHLPGLIDDETYLDWLAVNTLVQSNDTYHKKLLSPQSS